MALSDEIGPTLQKVEQNLTRTKHRFVNGMRGQKGKLANRALSAIRTVPGTPVYPIRWTSDRQRRAFFASRGFGRGIPTQRRNTLVNAWDVEFVPDQEGGLIVMSNPYEAAQYLFGPRTQGFHLDTGYVQLDDVVEDFFDEAAETAAVVFYGECDPLEGL